MSEKIIIMKNEALAMFSSQAEMARALGITRSAVSQWPDDRPIPEAQALKLRYQLRPEQFEASA